MSGIDREIFLDPRHIPKHLPNTPQSQRLLLRGRAIHVFNDEDTMLRVAQAILKGGEHTGSVRNYERYGLSLLRQSAIGLVQTVQELLCSTVR